VQQQKRSRGPERPRRGEAVGGLGRQGGPTQSTETPLQKRRGSPLTFTGAPSPDQTTHPYPISFSNSFPWLPKEAEPQLRAAGGIAEGRRRLASASKGIALPISQTPGALEVSDSRLSFLFIKWPYFASRKQALVIKSCVADAKI